MSSDSRKFQMLQNLKIGTRLALAFALLLALIAALAAGGISGSRQLTERSATLYGDRMVPMGLLAEISHLTQHNRVLVMDMLMDPGTRNLQSSHAALTTNVERINTLWKTYASRPLRPDEDALAKAFATVNNTYLEQGLIPAASALVAGKYDDGSELYISQIRPNAVKVQVAAEQLVALQIEVAAAEFAAARHLSENIHVWMMGATALALLIGAGMALVITRSISRPLRQAVAVAQTVAGGDLSTQIEVRGTDETAELLRALREMNNQLVHVITQVGESTARVAGGAAFILDGTEDLAKRTEVQASSLQETAASMEQLTTTVQHNTDNASRAATLAHEASLVANEGRAVMQDVIATMQEINSQSRKVTDIIKVIDDIAFQTNLLALNAAVEAARAGEQGRGFAVVAGEVRRLSQRSSMAAREIRALISANVRGVELGSSLVSQAGERVANTVTHVNHVVSLITQIKDASQEQARGISLVNEAVRHLDTVTQQNAALVDDNSIASTGMKTQVRHLLEVIHQFKLIADGVPYTLEATARPMVNGPTQRALALQRNAAEQWARSPSLPG